MSNYYSIVFLILVFLTGMTAPTVSPTISDTVSPTISPLEPIPFISISGIITGNVTPDNVIVQLFDDTGALVGQATPDEFGTFIINSTNATPGFYRIYAEKDGKKGDSITDLVLGENCIELSLERGIL